MKKNSDIDSWEELEPDLESVLDTLSDPDQADKRITDIAFDAGYIDLKQFNRRFRKATDMCPMEYRAFHTQFQRVTGMTVDEYKQKRNGNGQNGSV
ncbi:MAG TPA: AraC family transcriptional regulator [Balneolaceae bacterium]|nr:AraC family transcriptional regulator [Balneolaceae bacterium]